jgi:competence protein ComEC
MALILLATALLGWALAKVRAERPLQPSWLNRRQKFSIYLERCTLRTNASGRRIHGFGRLVLQNGSDGQQIYYNLSLPDKLPRPIVGQRIQVLAKIRRTTPSGPTFERYLLETGVCHRVVQGKVLSLGPVPPFAKYLAAAHDRALRSLQFGLPPHSSEAGIYGAMLLGDRSAMDAGDKNTYSRVGIAHLFAVSGLHIGVIAALLGTLTKPLPLPQSALFLLRMVPLMAFVLLVGASPSSVRALAMVSLLWLAPLLSRRASGLSSLTLSAFATLLLSPTSLLSTSFQFSYGVVFSLLLYGAPLGNWIRRALAPSDRKHSLLRHGCIRMGQLFAMSLAATLPLIPLSLFHFQTFSLGGILLNPLAIPLATPAMVCGFSSLCLGFFGVSAGCLCCNTIALPLLHLIHVLAHAVDRWQWVTSRPMAIGCGGTLLWFAAIVATLCRCRRPCHPLLFWLAPVCVAIFPPCWLRILG